MHTVTVADSKIMYITISCTRTASSGSTPARSKPVIAPGSAINPTTLVLSICIVNAVRIILGARKRTAVFLSAPRAKNHLHEELNCK